MLRTVHSYEWFKGNAADLCRRLDRLLGFYEIVSVQLTNDFMQDGENMHIWIILLRRHMH